MKLQNLFVGLTVLCSSVCADTIIDTRPHDTFFSGLEFTGPDAAGGTFFAVENTLASFTLTLGGMNSFGKAIVLGTAGGVPTGPVLWESIPIASFGGFSDWTFNPNLAITPGQEYFIGIDTGIFTTETSDFQIGLTTGNPMAGTAWGNIDNIGWFISGGGDFDVASRIVMTTDPNGPPPVPEPGTIALFGLAAIGYGLYRRRRSAS